MGQEPGVSLYWRSPYRETWRVGNKCSLFHNPTYHPQQYHTVRRKWQIGFKDMRYSELQSYQNLRKVSGATWSLPLSSSGSSLLDFYMHRLNWGPSTSWHPFSFTASAFCGLSHWSDELGGIFISPFYWCENWGSGDVQYLVQGHSANRWGSRDLDLSLCHTHCPLLLPQDGQGTWLIQPYLFVCIPGCEKSVWVHRHLKTCPFQQKWTFLPLKSPVTNVTWAARVRHINIQSPA